MNKGDLFNEWHGVDPAAHRNNVAEDAARVVRWMRNVSMRWGGMDLNQKDILCSMTGKLEDAPVI
jgi:hypothetical protein